MKKKIRTRFTPGPWRLGEPYTKEWGAVISSNEDWICDPGGGSGYEDEREANGRLIAAAPAMFEALVYSMNEFKSIGLDKAATYISKVLKSALGEHKK